jgi:hypothetical protein
MYAMIAMTQAAINAPPFFQITNPKHNAQRASNQVIRLSIHRERMNSFLVQGFLITISVTLSARTTHVSTIA